MRPPAKAAVVVECSYPSYRRSYSSPAKRDEPRRSLGEGGSLLPLFLISLLFLFLLAALACAVSAQNFRERQESAEDSGHYSNMLSLCYSEFASLAIPSRINRNTVHSSIGLAPSAR